MGNIFLTGALAWAVPGLGHLMLKRWIEGGLLLGGFVVLLVLGVVLGGLYYPGNPADTGLIYWGLHQFSCLGNGIFLLTNLFFKHGFQSTDALDAFRSAYFEYGGRFLALAGLLNYLAILDVVDIGLRRKA